MIVISLAYIVYFYLSQSKTSVTNVSINDIQVLDTETTRSTVDSFFDKYIQAGGNNEKSGDVVREFGTKNLLEYYEKNQQTGPIVCSTELPAKTIVTKSEIKDGQTAIVLVEHQFKNSKKIVAVNLTKDNGIKVDSINCSPDQGQPTSQNP